MYFTIGAHPAFRFAKKDEVKSDYILKFPGKDQLEYILVDKETEDGMGTAIPEEKRTLKLENNTYVLNEEIFDNDALIWMELRLKKHGYVTRMEHLMLE